MYNNMIESIYVYVYVGRNILSEAATTRPKPEEVFFYAMSCVIYFEERRLSVLILFYTSFYNINKIL